jgi:hypothetical protein
VTASVSKRNSAGVHAGLVLVLISDSVQRHISGCCFNPIVYGTKLTDARGDCCSACGGSVSRVDRGALS